MYACGGSICRGSHKCDLSGFRAPTCRSPASGRRATMPALVGSDPPGVPGVACRRGTCGCPGIMSEPRSEASVYRRRDSPAGVDSAAAQSEHSPFAASTGERSDPTRLGRAPAVRCVCFNPPHLSETQSNEPRPSAAATRPAGGGRRRSRPTPCAQPSTTDHRSRSAASAPWAQRSAILPSRGKIAEGPQLRLALANADAQRRVCRRSGGTGSGGTPDKCGGKL